MGKKPHGGLSVLCLLCAWLQSVAAASAISQWHPDPHGIPAHHHALPPLSAPPPTAGADLPPSHAPGQQAAPHFGLPLQPTFGSAAPPVGGEGYPFIGSNPTVPLPTGMTDTTTVLPMPDTGAGTKVVGHAASVRARITITRLALLFSILLLWS